METDKTHINKQNGEVLSCPICLQHFPNQSLDNHITCCYFQKQKENTYLAPILNPKIHETPTTISPSSNNNNTSNNNTTSNTKHSSSSSNGKHKSKASSSSSSKDGKSKWESLPKLKSCPVFKPSEAEFKDPMKYIASISAKGKQYGIVKIIPPSDKWLQGKYFSKMISNKTFIFPTKVQNLYQLQRRDGPCSKFMTELEAFLEKRGTPIKSIPTLDGQELDLYSLYNLVLNRGGLQEVIKNKQWKNVARELHLSPECTNAAFLLKQNYYKYLYAFELSKKNKSEPENLEPWMLSNLQEEMGDLINLEQEKETKEKKTKEKKIKEKKTKEMKEKRKSPREKDKEKDKLSDEESKNKQGEFGYGDGKLHNLSSFKKMAKQFKRKWFGDNENVSASEIENTYWKIVETAEENVQVYYGSDLDVGTYGSGFPGRDNPAELKKASGWNLNKFPKLPESLLSYIEEEIKGVIQPMMYIGMLFSTFCWHTEDNHLYSINYLHHGAPKTWYGVPESAAAQFEEVMKKTVPHLFDSHPDLLFLLITMLSPRELVKHKVPIYHAIQQPGEFMITFPNAYHAGFSHGFNCAESTNFALIDWLPYGRKSIQLYRQFNRASVFSFEQLLCKMAQNIHSPDHIPMLRQEFSIMKNEECALRQKVFNESIWRTAYFDSYTDKILECSICKYDCYLSAVTCPCSPEKITCLNHSHLSCQCPGERKILLFRHKISDFEDLMKNIGMEVPSLSLSKPYLQNLLNEEKSTQISFGISSKGRKKLVAPRSQDLIGVSKPAIRKLARRGGVYPVKGLEYQEKINPLDEIYTIDSILDKRVIQGQLEYLVKWKGYSIFESTWEKESNLVCPVLINSFLDRRGIKRPSTTTTHSPRKRKKRMMTMM